MWKAGWGKPLVLWCCLGIGATSVVGSSATFQDCEHTQKNKSTYRAIHEQASWDTKTAARVRLHLACAAHTIDENEGLLNLLATIFIAGFTGTLWLSTRNLWKASERQLSISERQLTDLERPWLFIDLQFGISQGQIRGQRGTYYHGPMITLMISNHGRFPATIEDCHIGIAACIGPSEVVMKAEEWRDTLAPGASMPNLQFPIPGEIKFAPMPGVATFGAGSPVLIEGQKLFCRAVVNYTGVSDALVYRTGSCWWRDQNGRWVLVRDREITYRT